MPTLTIEYRSEAERLAILRAAAFVSEMHDLALAAPDGQVLDLCEGQSLEQGRALLRLTLQHAVQARIDNAQEKGATPVSVHAAAATTSSDLASGR